MFPNCTDLGFSEFEDSDRECSECSEKDSEDILKLLPADPFGMDIRSAFMKGWIEDVKDLEFRVLDEENTVDGQLFAGLNLVFDENSVLFDGFCVDDGLFDVDFVSDSLDELLGFSCVRDRVVNDKDNKVSPDCTKNVYPDSAGDAPHDALFYVLGYLGVKDLLSMESVCKSMRDAVKGDPLLWRRIHIDHDLSDKITDDVLVELSSMAQGTLRCLNLMQCIKITDDGVKRVLECNSGLTMLSVPGCVRLTVDGILHNLKVFKSIAKPGLKHLRVGGMRGVTNKHFEELKHLLGVEKYKAQKPRFYYFGHLYQSCDDDRTLDIETCPQCQKTRLIYDCPAEGCQSKNHTAQMCRGCIVCISRCINCGRCIKDCDYQETFYLDLLCLDCWKEVLNCEERLEDQKILATKHTIIHQETRYHFCLYG